MISMTGRNQSLGASGELTVISHLRRSSGCDYEKCFFVGNHAKRLYVTESVIGNYVGYEFVRGTASLIILRLLG